MAKPGRFSPGVIDYDDMSARYQSGRALSGKAANTWLATVAPFVQRSARPRIIDLGAGTGRFSVLFARSFEATVIGIEPSMGMLAAAAHEKPRPDGLTYVAGAAERLPLADTTCDVVWLSHVWHHIRDHQACAAELRRVVRTGSHVLVRGTFGDRLDGFPTVFRFWPATRAICEQLPTIQETVRVFETNQFTLVDHQRVPQETAANLGEFARRTQARADSALVLISDAEFHLGQAAIEAAAGREPDPVPVIEVIELLIFRKR
jgi:ubiquinone/menaquinone biosynthesis C-methylase UbiE